MAHTHDMKPVINRLARAIGHLTSVKTMVESGRDCTDVIMQLEAVKSAINSTQKVILEEHVTHCIVDAIKSGDMEKVDELNKVIKKMI